MNPEAISTELTEMCAIGYEDFLRRERLWESAERDKIMARHEQDRTNVLTGMRNGVLLLGAIVGAVIWIILHV